MLKWLSKKVIKRSPSFTVFFCRNVIDSFAKIEPFFVKATVGGGQPASLSPQCLNGVLSSLVAVVSAEITFGLCRQSRWCSIVSCIFIIEIQFIIGFKIQSLLNVTVIPISPSFNGFMTSLTLLVTDLLIRISPSSIVEPIVFNELGLL